MNFKSFVDNPIKVIMLFLAMALMGYLSLRRLPLNLFPNIQTPRITVVATTKGMTPEETERRLTIDFERQLTSIKGVANITSYSREGSIVIHVDFHWDQHMEFAYLDVKKNVGMLETNENVKSVEVYRFDPNAAPLITLAFTPVPNPNAGTPTSIDSITTSVDRVQLTNLVENTLKPRLETIKGVAYVKAGGISRREVAILVNGDIMTQYDLTTDNIIQAIRSQNVSVPGGVIIEGNEQVTLKFVSRFRDVNDIRHCVVTIIEDHPIHLEDIGELKISPSRDEVIIRQDGIETVTLDIFREPDANTIQTAQRVRELVERLNSQNDYGLKIAMDRSVEVKTAIGEVVGNVIAGMALAIIILWLFLRNVMATIVTGISIPISIIATFSLMYFQGLSLNIMTLGGLALGAGMLVDNSIVVIENIFRHRKTNPAPADAAVIGTREVAMAITASTLTTVVVFVPLVYVHGIAGILFKDQALTVVYSLMISLLVALVLLPMLASRIAPCPASTSEGLLDRFYGRFLADSLKRRWLLLILFLLMMAFTWLKARDIPSRFFPEAVGGQISLLTEMPSGTSLEQTERVTRRLEEPLLKLRYRDKTLAPLIQAYEVWKISGDLKRFLIMASSALRDIEKNHPGHPLLPELKKNLFPREWDGIMEKFLQSDEAEKARLHFVKRISAMLEPQIVIQSITTTVGMESESLLAAGERILGPNTARMEIVINPTLLRELSADDVIRLLRSEAAKIPNLKYNFESRNEFIQQIVGRDRGDVVMEVHAEKLRDLRDSASAVANTLNGIPGIANIRTNLILGEEEYLLTPDHDALLRGQYKVSDLSAQIQAYLRGERSEQVKLDQGEMGILVKNPRSEREGLEGLLNLEIISPQGGREKLKNLATLKKERGVREIMRVNQERTLIAMADLDGTSYQEAVKRVRHALDSMPWRQSGSSWNMSGEEVRRRESFDNLFFALIIAIVLVYMVIAAILESIIHPLTIMLSVPLAGAGVVASFLMTGISLNLMGYIGIVMLTGIVVNNAIVLLDRIQQIRDMGGAGASVFDAVVLAGRQRLRPILMTSLTTIIALVPLAMGFGQGAELRRPMAIAVIGGLTSSTLLTLWIMPVLYLIVEDGIAFIKRLRFSGGKKPH